MTPLLIVDSPPTIPFVAHNREGIDEHRIIRILFSARLRRKRAVLRTTTWHNYEYHAIRSTSLDPLTGVFYSACIQGADHEICRNESLRNLNVEESYGLQHSAGPALAQSVSLAIPSPLALTPVKTWTRCISVNGESLYRRRTALHRLGRPWIHIIRHCCQDV